MFVLPTPAMYTRLPSDGADTKLITPYPPERAAKVKGVRHTEQKIHARPRYRGSRNELRRRQNQRAAHKHTHNTQTHICIYRKKVHTRPRYRCSRNDLDPAAGRFVPAISAANIRANETRRARAVNVDTSDPTACSRT